MVGAAARIAYSGAIHGYDRIVALGNGLEGRIRRRMRDRSPEPAGSVPKQNPTGLRGVDSALARWENEGGAFPSDQVLPPVRSPSVSRAGFPRYLNDVGARAIRIGATQFHCMGALPPHDHPHIYLNIEGKPGIPCPYCSTIYTYDPRLRPDRTDPEGCFHSPIADAMPKSVQGGAS